MLTQELKVNSIGKTLLEFKVKFDLKERSIVLSTHDKNLKAITSDKYILWYSKKRTYIISTKINLTNPLLNTLRQKQKMIYCQ